MLDNILMERFKRKSTSNIDINTGLQINGEDLTFVTKIFEDIGFSLMFPESFIVMENHLAKLKFLSENRPEIIFMSENTTVNFTFSNTNETFIDDTIKLLSSFKTAIKNLQPANLFLEQKELESDIKLGYMDYVTYAVDGKLYCLMYVFEVQGNLIIGSFSCPIDISEYWKPVVIAMIKTIELIEEK